MHGRILPTSRAPRIPDRRCRIRTHARLALVLATIAAFAPLASAQHHAPAVRQAGNAVPLFEDLGSHHVAISTRVPAAQQYFDQGMRLVYGFNHPEAIRAFDEAARLDADCAICHWGAALAFGPNINAPMDSASGVAAYQHLREAIALRSKASARERAFIDALAKRYALPLPADRAPLDSAYAHAMADVVRRYPKDLDAATLYAEALMDLRPWNFWRKDGSPYPGTDVILAQLERVMKADSDHPGACHYYIHAVEAMAPERAVACAERLAALMPGAGHIVHMPGHIYIRVGRYDDAIKANEHAVHTDETYIEREKPSGFYPIGYYPHNLHFLAFAASMAGRSAEAIDAARKTSEKTPAEVARQAPPLEALHTYTPLTLVTFGKWDEVLAAPLPPSDLRLSTGLAYYARGVAHAARGQWPQARAALDTVKAIAAGTSPHDQIALSAGGGENRTIMDIAMHALTGEIADRSGQSDAASHFQEAVQLQDTFNYTEPPQWYYPMRHSLGAVLLRQGKAAEAERVYQEDLNNFPENGWALFGLMKALQAQGKVAEARTVEARFQKAWAGADVTLTASRF
jgi:tetratricopeptide (TPR) repeat protein